MLCFTHPAASTRECSLNCLKFLFQITVSSGGMYLQKLNVADLQNKKGTFDGEMSYAQNKRQQVISIQF